MAMDKLELDARVARLERRVSLILTLPFMILGLLVLVAMSMAFVGRASVTAVPTAPPSPAVIAVEDHRSMHRLDGELRKLHALLEEDLINAGDFQAKKKNLLFGILHIDDFAGDMQMAKKLLDENILNISEYDELKKKILGIDR
jgi:hypothetical protein